MNLPIGLNRMFAAAAARYGERPGLIDRRSTLSYAEAATQVAALADLIRALGPRPVVASLIDNSVEGVLLFAAISAAGGVNVCLEPRMREEDVARAIALTNPALVVVDTDRAAGDAAVAAANCAVRLTREDSLVREIESAIARSTLERATDEFEPGAILFTSGSTGEPKGVLKSEAALWWNVVESTIWGARTTAVTEIFAIPLGHLNFWDVALPAYWSGGGVYLMEGFSAEGFIETAQRFDEVSTCITPGMMARILDAGSDRTTLPSLASVVLWSDLADDLRLELVDAHGEIFRFCYGITEGSSFAASTREFVTHPGACGRPVGFCSLEIRDENNSPLPMGESGQVWERTPTAYTRYVGAADPAKARRDGPDCFYTGDLGRLDAEGRLYLEGRDGLAIKTGGLNVRPADVEAALTRHPGVRSCIVVGTPDREWGEAVVAVVEPKLGATLDSQDLMAFARDHLAGYQCPKQLLVVDKLPIMANGKFDRRGIKAAVATGELAGLGA